LAVLVDLTSPIGDQAAGSGKGASIVDRGQLVAGRQRDNQIPMNKRRPTRRHDQPAIRSARESCDGALDLAGVAHVDRIDLHPERRRHGLDHSILAGSGAFVLDALGDAYLKIAMEQAIDPALLHRVAVIASGTLDSLPHNGAVVTLLAVCGTTHRDSYPDIVIVGIVGAILALAGVVTLGSILGSF